MRKVLVIMSVVCLLTIGCAGCAKKEPPVASIFVESPVLKLGEKAVFDGTGSIDADGDIVSYEWDFGDGDVASGGTVSHMYDIPGSYTITLTVVDDDQLSDKATIMCDVTLGVTVRLDVTSSTWREGKQPYDVSTLVRNELETQGFRVVQPGNTKYDATLVVDYNERKGGWYIGGGYGTEIECLLRLRDRTGEDLFQHAITASSYSAVLFSEGEDPSEKIYKTAVWEFEDHVYIAYLSQILAAKYGVGREISILIDALQSGNVRTRETSADALGDIGDRRAVERLIECLGDDAADVRASAAAALGNIMDPRAVPALICALSDKAESVRANAAVALGKIGDPKAVESLNIVANEDESEFVRERARMALEKID